MKSVHQIELDSLKRTACIGCKAVRRWALFPALIKSLAEFPPRQGDFRKETGWDFSRKHP
jgi:hypothetical protein